jgi:hypothetical protein
MASRLFAITLLLLSVFAIPVHATELTLVTGDQYAPFTDQRLPHGGMISEMVKVIFQKMGVCGAYRFQTLEAWLHGSTREPLSGHLSLCQNR